MLLNASVSSVAHLGALRRVVDAAVANAVTTQPLTIQDAVAQVVVVVVVGLERRNKFPITFLVFSNLFFSPPSFICPTFSSSLIPPPPFPLSTFPPFLSFIHSFSFFVLSLLLPLFSLSVPPHSIALSISPYLCMCLHVCMCLSTLTYKFIHQSIFIPFRWWRHQDEM